MAIVTNGTLVTGRLVRGDAFPIYRKVRITTGSIVSKAWLTVKSSPLDADPGVLQKDITAVPTANGVIEESGASGFPVAIIRFDLSSTDTQALTADQTYYYDIKIIFSSGVVETLEAGRFVPMQPITQAVS